MIYTSYYANSRNFIPNFDVYSISLYYPKYYKFVTGHVLELAPTTDILTARKYSSISNDEYTKRYNSEVLDKLNVDEYGNTLDNSILLCYETPEFFCHRHLVNDWLTTAGFEVSELGTTNSNLELLGL